MASSLQLMHFNPAAAFHNDLAAGTQTRLVFYRAISVNAADDDGLTMLAHAARVGDADAVKILLERGADQVAREHVDFSLQNPARARSRPQCKRSQWNDAIDVACQRTK